MKALAKGDRAPDFTLKSPDGTIANLKSINQTGPIVIVFLPDINHSDTTEILDNFRDDYNEFTALKASLIPVVHADDNSVGRLHEEHNLNFPVFADPDGELFRLYGAREGFLIKRPRKYAYVVDREQTVSKAFRSVDSNKFSRQALYALRDQMGRSALHNVGQKESSSQKKL